MHAVTVLLHSFKENVVHKKIAASIVAAIFHMEYGGDEESRTPVRKCSPMNFSECSPLFVVSNSYRTRTNYTVPACEFPAAAFKQWLQGIPLSDVYNLPAGLAERDVSRP